MGEKAAEWVGMDRSEVPVTIADSVKGILSVIDSATKEETSGKFFNHEGEIVPW
jgi:hypothetical protein